MNIGFVGVGRMGANMARRLKDRGFHVTTVFDVNRAAATSLAQELGCAASPTLGDVSAGADVIFTIVTDDAAMREIFTGAGQPSGQREREIVHQLRHRFAGDSCGSRAIGGSGWSVVAGSVHGFQHHAGARRFALSDVRRPRRKLPARRTDPEGIERVASLHREIWRGREGKSAGQHGDEHQHRRARGRPWPWAQRSGLIWRCCEMFFRKPAPTRGFSKPTAKTCRIAITAVSFRPRMRRRTVASRFSSRETSVSIFRWRARRRNSTTAWSPKDWANSTNQALPS